MMKKILYILSFVITFSILFITIPTHAEDTPIPVTGDAQLTVATLPNPLSGNGGSVSGVALCTQWDKNTESCSVAVDLILTFNGSSPNNLCLVTITAKPTGEIANFYKDAKCSTTFSSRRVQVQFGKLPKGTNVLQATYIYKDSSGKSVPQSSSPVGLVIGDSNGKGNVLTTTSNPISNKEVINTEPPVENLSSSDELTAQTGVGPFSNIGKFINEIMRKYAVPFALMATLFMIIFAGYNYITSGGAPEQVTLSKEIIVGALLGLTTILLFGWLLASILPSS